MVYSLREKNKVLGRGERRLLPLKTRRGSGAVEKGPRGEEGDREQSLQLGKGSCREIRAQTDTLQEGGRGASL